MPQGTFIGAGVKTVVLFFNKGEKTDKIWYYQLDPGRNMGKTNPLNDKDLVEFKELQKTQEDTEKSWVINVSDIESDTFDLSPKNPNAPEEAPLRAPNEILAEMEQLDARLRTYWEVLKSFMKQDWEIQKLKVVEFQGEVTPKSTLIYEPKDSYEGYCRQRFWLMIKQYIFQLQLKTEYVIHLIY